MKKYLLLFFAELIFTIAHAQPAFEPLLALTKYERAVKGEVEADIEIIAETGNISIHFNAPVFLKYNLNDIRMFSAAPLKYLGLFKESTPDLTLLAEGYYTDRQSNRVEAGLLHAQTRSVAIEGETKVESTVTGKCENNLQIYFHIPNFKAQVKSGKTDLNYQLEISCPGTSYVQENVHGTIKIGDMAITEGLVLDVGIPKPLPDLEDIPDNAFIGTEKRENFMLEYFKNLPSIKVCEINAFLMMPSGKPTFDFSGNFAWRSHKYKVIYKGKITLDGSTVKDVNN
jgi:hypothetical protein